jgi:hypothetical protein
MIDEGILREVGGGGQPSGRRPVICNRLFRHPASRRSWKKGIFCEGRGESPLLPAAASARRALLLALQLFVAHAVEGVDAVLVPRNLAPVEELRRRIDLVVEAAVGEDRELVQVFGEPRCRLRQMDEAVLEAEGRERVQDSRADDNLADDLLFTPFVDKITIIRKSPGFTARNKRVRG